MSAPTGSNYHYVATKRRVKEDKRFVTGKGNYIQDVALPDLRHVAVLPSPHARARIVNIDASAALALPGVHTVVTGAELAEHVNPLYHGIPMPEVKWLPLANEMTRYAGEWVAAVVADSVFIA